MPRGRSGSGGNGLPKMCAPRQPAAKHLAVLGVLSTEAALHLRNAARSTWMSQLTNGSQILPKFVIRGINASQSMVSEHERHGDVVFVRAPASLRRESGPLRSIVLWWECALHAWPNAQLIGKADDDTWLHLRGVALLLQRSLAVATRELHLKQTRLYWGLMETFSWHVERGEPVGWQYAFRRHGASAPCSGHLQSLGHAVTTEAAQRAPSPGSRSTTSTTSTSSSSSTTTTTTTHQRPSSSMDDGPDADHRMASPTIIGPFSFAKGPLFFLSSALARTLTRAAELRHYIHRVANTPRLPRQLIPFEDVMTGLGLSVTAGPPNNLVAVHAPPYIFAAATGHYGNRTHPMSTLRPYTLIWHESLKKAARIYDVHRWMADHHCLPPSPPMRTSLACPRPYASCANASWLRCHQQLAMSANATCRNV